MRMGGVAVVAGVRGGERDDGEDEARWRNCGVEILY